MKSFKKFVFFIACILSSSCFSKMNYFELKWSWDNYSGTIYKWQKHAESCITVLQKKPLYFKAIIVDLKKRYPNLAHISDEELLYDPDTKSFFNPKMICNFSKTKERNKILRENPNATFVDDIPESQELLDSALVYAVWHRDLDLVNKLLKSGANANSKQAPLITAAKGGYVNIAKKLIEHGANVNMQDDAMGWTPLHWAINTYSLDPKSAVEMVKLLLEKKANVNIKSHSGVSAFDMGIKAGGAMAELFIKRKP